MSTDKPLITLNMSRIQLDLLEAIEDNGGEVECSQVPDIFFPADFSPSNYELRRMAEKTAREICFRCPVLAECLKVGMHEPFGIWGGTTPEQRKQIRRTYEI